MYNYIENEPFILSILRLENTEFTRMVDSIRANGTGGPLYKPVSQVAVGDVLGLAPEDPPEVRNYGFFPHPKPVYMLIVITLGNTCAHSTNARS
jgi:hypothetical protein